MPMQQNVCYEGEQRMKQPVFEHGLVSGVCSQTPSHDDGIRNSSEAHQEPNQ